MLKEVADNPSHLEKIWAAVKSMGLGRTLAEVRAKFSEYAVLGYSGAGVVVDKYPTVTDLEVGERVAYGGEGTGHAEVVLVGRNLAVRVPPAVPFDQACFATVGSIALNAVRISEISLGEVVAVIGLGLVGQLVAQLVRVQGGVVVGIDLRQERVALAKRLGADHQVGLGLSAREAVMEATRGRRADAAIVVAAAIRDHPPAHRRHHPASPAGPVPVLLLDPRQPGGSDITLGGISVLAGGPEGKALEPARHGVPAS